MKVWFHLPAVCLLAAALVSCQPKSTQTDAQIFKEGKGYIKMTADPARGIAPLRVSFIAYLENEERALEREAKEVKWRIRGPNRFERDIVTGSENLQDPAENQSNAFYLDFTFLDPGTYRVKLILNEGEFSSRNMVIRVQEDPMAVR